MMDAEDASTRAGVVLHDANPSPSPSRGGGGGGGESERSVGSTALPRPSTPEAVASTLVVMVVVVVVVVPEGLDVEVVPRGKADDEEDKEDEEVTAAVASGATQEADAGRPRVRCRSPPSFQSRAGGSTWWDTEATEKDSVELDRRAATAVMPLLPHSFASPS